jgi:tetratricopeptide (TPR) repeat protein
MKSITPALTVLLGLAACAVGPDPAPLFDDLGAYRRSASTDSAAARRYFDQGLLWTYGFNHDEAVRSFREAQRLDPGFALAHWGEAFALGPNINLPMTDPAVAKQAYDASRRALARLDGCTAVERALIEALALRYADPSPERRADLDRAYADAMAEVWRRFPDDPDVGALFADARMNQRPWAYWTADGRPEPGIEAALDALRSVIAAHPRHPGAHHFMIHVTESSPDPAEGVPSAEVLASLVPGSGHLVHMPAHTFQRVGRYRDAEEANRRAVAVDRAYFDRVGSQGIYEFYRAHNHHFRAYAAMFGGRFEAALESARDLLADLPPHFLIQMAPFVDGYLPVEAHVLVRFGRWEEVLELPDFEPSFPIGRTMRRYARGIAFAATGRVAEARAEQQAFEIEARAVGADAMIGINPALPVVAIARDVLEGEILYREGRHQDAFAALDAAAAKEDGLRYDEPSPWMMPVRHAIGALALEQGQLERAERAYREDLERNPENGWALHGLVECLRRRDAGAEVAVVEARFAKAWAHADTSLEHGSCFCRGKLAAAAAPCCEPGPIGAR